MRDWSDQADLFHCTAPGLRKAVATIAAETSATDEEPMAIFGWTTKSQTTTYDLSDHFSSVVPHAGVEPALLSKLDFESSASTNSANGATDTDEPGV